MIDKPLLPSQNDPMNAEEKTYDFASVVKHFDITPRTLRYYEYLELIFPVREGRKRYYTKREMARIQLILNGRRFGFKLEEIRQWLELYNPRTDNREQIMAWVEKASQQVSELEERRAELDMTINDLKTLLNEAQEYLQKLEIS